MEAQSVVERLASLNPETEIWWDSSPLVYDNWKQQMIADSAPGDRDGLDAQLTRFLDLDDINSSLACGVTTNPPLSLQAIEGRPDIWEPWIDALIEAGPDADVEVIFWKTYLEVVRRGAEIFRPMWELDKNLQFEAVVDEPVPAAILNKLLRVPFFSEAHAEEMNPERYRSMAPMIFTMNQFAKATERTVQVIGDRIAAIRGHA